MGTDTPATRRTDPADTEATTRFEIVTDVARLRQIEEEWRALASDIPSPMAQFEWIISAAEAFHQEPLFVVTMWQGRVLQAAAPFVLRRHGLTRRLEFIDYKLFEPQRLLARSRVHLDKLLRFLLELPHPFVIRALTAGSEDIGALGTMACRGLKVVASTGDKDSYVSLNGEGLRLESRMSAKRRSNLKRRLKAMEKCGAVRFDITRPAAQDLPELLDEFFRVESSGWKGQAATGLQHDLRQAAFFRAYCDRMARLGRLRLGFLRVGEAIAAVRLEVVWDNKSWEFKIGYDQDFATSSPGLLLSHETLKRGEAEGLSGHHFLGTDESWHDTWSAEKSERFSISHYPASWAGRVALLQHKGVKAAKAILRNSRKLQATIFKPKAP